jgi:hypothetical protein
MRFQFELWHFSMIKGLMSEAESEPRAELPKKRKSGIPAGNAGEYFVMGELLRRGFDAQLADRNTASYDLLVGRQEEASLHKVQIKTVRSPPWYVKVADFEGDMAGVTIYVLLGDERASKAVRYFITFNRELAEHIHRPPGWPTNAFMPLKAVERYENCWDLLNVLNLSS